MKKSCDNCKWLTCEDSEICEIGIDANACINWEESELSKCQRELADTKKLAYTPTMSGGLKYLDLYKEVDRKLKIAVEALMHYAGEPFETNDIYLDIFDHIKHTSASGVEFNSDAFRAKAVEALEKIKGL